MRWKEKVLQPKEVNRNISASKRQSCWSWGFPSRGTATAFAKSQEEQDMQDHNLACGSVWVWNLVSDIKGGTQTEGV
jgi:hypothetical protein